MKAIDTIKCPKCQGKGRILNPSTAGPLLRERRLKNGVSAKDIAGSLCISPQYLTDLEHGRRPMNEGMIEIYEGALEELKPSRKARKS